jgi:uncharacterized membrane protein YfcA
VVNAIAGGGTFLTFGAMTLAGVPPIMANATSSVTQFPGYVTSALAYRTEIRRGRPRGLDDRRPVDGGQPRRRADPGVDVQPVVPFAGAVAAARRHHHLCPGPLSAAEIAACRAADHSKLGHGGRSFITSIYGGFFGAGMGIMMLAVLGLTKGGDYHKLNALKNVTAVVIAFVALLVFSGGGVVAWLPACDHDPGRRAWRLCRCLGRKAGAADRSFAPWSSSVGLLLSWYYFAS